MKNLSFKAVLLVLPLVLSVASVSLAASLPKIGSEAPARQKNKKHNKSAGRNVFLRTIILPQTLTGGVNGGGGKGVVCRDEHGRIEGKVELLDLWEAENIFGVKIDPALNAKSVNELADSTIEGIKDSLDDPNRLGTSAVAEELRRHIQIFEDPRWSAVHRQHGVTLELTPDSFEIEYPSDCGVEQIVTYLDQSPDGDAYGQVFINQDLVDKMDHVNEAALYSHEVFYHYLRQAYHEPDSRRVRRTVGYVMGGKKFNSFESFMSDKYLLCTADQYQGKWSSSYIYVKQIDSGTGPFVYNAMAKKALDQPAIGNMAPSGYAGASLIDSLMRGTNDCDSSNPIIDADVFYLSGSGPVDFDHKYGSFFAQCKSGKISVYLSPTNELDRNPDGSADIANAQELKCVVKTK